MNICLVGLMAAWFGFLLNAVAKKEVKEAKRKRTMLLNANYDCGKIEVYLANILLVISYLSLILSVVIGIATLIQE